MAAWRRSRRRRGWRSAPRCPARRAASRRRWRWRGGGLGARTSSPSTWAAPPPTSRWSRAARPRSAAAASWAASASRCESLDIVTLGAGGGSIAHLGAGGTLQVGPRSAGAVPGPACYGAGGTEPTVTDANLVLGYLDPGELPRRPQAAGPGGGGARGGGRWRRSSASRMEACALGIHRLVNARMADGVRVATVRRGVDPRDFDAAGLRRRGRAARQRGGARARPQARRGAAVRRGALGLGHAAIRPALRGARRARSAPPACRPRPRSRALFDALESQGRARMAGWYAGRGRGAAQRRHALWRAGLRDRRAAGRHGLDGPRAWPTGCAPPSTRATARSSPTTCRRRRWCW